MKFDIKILPAGGGYEGHVLLNGEVVYSTGELRNVIEVSAATSKYIAANQSKAKDLYVPQGKYTRMTARQCCGRG